MHIDSRGLLEVHTLPLALSIRKARVVSIDLLEEYVHQTSRYFYRIDCDRISMSSLC